MVGKNAAFEIPLSELGNVQLNGKTEVAFEFQQDEEAYADDVSRPTDGVGRVTDRVALCGARAEDYAGN